VDGILGPKVTRRLEASLLAYFDLKNTGPCSHLRSFIENFISSLCEKLDAELLRKSAENIDGKSFDDWRSWYIDEAIQIQAHAIGNFAHRIIDVETLSSGASQKVPCDLGYKNAEEFFDCWRAATQSRRDQLKISPQSQRFRDKRKNHQWAPYFSDLFLKIS
jgi:hypothetical protein